MPRTLLALVAASTLTALFVSRTAADPPATGVAAVELQQYFYIDFPCRLESINNQIALAEAELNYQARRADLYRPMRSFHQYGATYLADQSAQISVLAAKHDLDCLRDQRIALWRERQAVAQRMLTPAQ